MPNRYRYVPGMGFIMSREDSMSHYGVPGMKWGFRKDSSSSGSGKSGGKQAAAKASSMSDSDLQKAVNRLNLEKQYKTLTATPSQKAASAVAKVTGEAVKTVGKKLAVQAIQAGVDKAIATAIPGGG